MKHQLWILNSALCVLFIVAIAINDVLKTEPPVWRPKKVFVEAPEKKKEAEATTAWDKIFQDDIFDTFVVTVATPVKKTLTAPIPEIKAPLIVPPPEPQKQDFVPPLNITLKGIIIAADENKNVVMIADETGKEGLYHLGEMIKDAQIIKIARTRIVLLRANGQQDVFFLRKDENLVDPASPDRWKLITKKIDDQNYEIDPREFGKEIETLGNLLERASVIGTAYHLGQPIGVRIGTISPNDIGAALGLQQNDIILAINNISVADLQNRINLYNTITTLPLGSSIQVSLQRAGKNVMISYKLAQIEKPKRYTTMPGIKIAGQPQQEMAMSRMQQRDKEIREFNKAHDGSHHQQTIMDIRRRLLENLQNRMQNSRNR